MTRRCARQNGCAEQRSVRAQARSSELPPVSVIVPARDAEATLSGALRSILAQDYAGDVEVIVADGSESTATRDLLRAQFPQVRRIPNPDRGIAAGLNRALAAARGTVIARCDAHSVLPRGYLTRAATTLAGTGADNVGGRQRPVGATFFERAVALVTGHALGTGGARYRVGGPEGPADTVFLGVFRRDALERVGGWDETLERNEDYELNWRLRQRGGTVWFDPRLVTAYRPRGTLRALARQYFDYGRWKAVVLARHPRAWRARQLPAPVLVASLLLSALLLAAAPFAPAPDASAALAAAAAVAPFAYLLALAGASAAIALRNPDLSGLLVPAVAGTIHIAWGAGFLAGLPRAVRAAVLARTPPPGQAGARKRAAEPAPGTPPPAAVRYNDWPSVPVPAEFQPHRPVSVIIPTYQAPAALALTLAGLERQDWPGELLEVVVVDDGSDPPVTPPATSLDLRLVRQPRRGFGLARARNTGAKAARHDILVFLDGDVIAEAGLIRAHARWHHAVGDAFTQGFCAYVSSEGLRPDTVRAHRGALGTLFDGKASDPPWIERHMARTDDFTSRHTDLFRAVTGHNFGISRALFEEAGAFDESFTRYGGEDTEFGYRVQNSGGLLIPVRDAFAWHQGRWLDGRQAKRRDSERQAGKLADLIAEPGFRPPGAARRYAVPRLVVTLMAGTEPLRRVSESADALLANPDGDLAVYIDLAPGRDADRARLHRRHGHDPRLSFAASASALDRFPASPLHVVLPAAATVGPEALARLESALGDAVTASADLNGSGGRITITRAWALRRARRSGGTAADFGDARTVPARVLRPAPRVMTAPKNGARGRPAGPWSAAAQGARAVLSRLAAEARHVRGIRTAWRFLRWFILGVRWRVRQGFEGSSPAAHGVPPGRSEPCTAATPDPPLGVDLAALGPRSRAVFAASNRVRHEARTRLPAAVLADTRAAAAGVRAPRALLSRAPRLAVPAFDPALHNPFGWVRHVENRAVSLGPSDRLPPGAGARRSVAPGDRRALLHAHRLEDAGAFHANAIARAGTLARIAALGLPVRFADADRALEPLLGEALFRLMTADSRNAGAAEREALSIAQRREALRAHSLPARARQVCEAAGAKPPPLPRVSVLLATRRPSCLAHAVANVARQTYPNLELVLALHGPGFAAESVNAALAPFVRPVKVLHLDRECTLGAVLARASEAASGPLLAKMDDDDLYGPEHLWDLVLAREYSGAALVGKFPATVYLAQADRTVRVREVPPEAWSGSITGGTMLIARTDLQRAGGWRDLPRHVDAALVEDVHACGGGVYRTHDADYLLLRHGRSPTWRRDDGEFLADAQAVHRGWRPELAGLAGAPPPLAPPAIG